MKRRKRTGTLPEKVTSIYIILMSTVFLLWTGMNGYAAISNAKFIMFLVICGGYVTLMAAAIPMEAWMGKGKLPPIKTLIRGSSWVQRLVLVYMLLTWVSALLSPYWPETLLGVGRDEGALTITIYGLCFLLVSVYGKFQKYMLSCFAASVLLFDGLCLIQMTGANPFVLYPAGMDYFDANVYYSGTYLGTIGNVDFVAAFLCIVVGLFWVAAVRLKGRERVLPAVTLIVTLIVLWQMWVLAAVVGVCAGVALSLPVVLPLGDRPRKWMAIALAALVVGGVLALYFLDLGGGMLHEIHLLLHGQADDSFGSGRVYIWKNVLALIPARLWFGYGPDTMGLAGIEPFLRLDEELGVLIKAWIDTAHNEYLNVLYHQGIFALLAWLGALVTAAVGWVRYARKDWVAAAAGGAVLCYCVQAFFGISVCITAPYFWISLAILENRVRTLSRGKIM